jgi:hypothetical protein
MKSFRSSIIGISLSLTLLAGITGSTRVAHAQVPLGCDPTFNVLDNVPNTPYGKWIFTSGASRVTQSDLGDTPPPPSPPNSVIITGQGEVKCTWYYGWPAGSKLRLKATQRLSISALTKQNTGPKSFRVFAKLSQLVGSTESIVGDVTPSFDAWSEHVINVPEFTQEIRIRGLDTTGNSVYIDDVQLEALPPPPPQPVPPGSIPRVIETYNVHFNPFDNQVVEFMTGSWGYADYRVNSYIKFAFPSGTNLGGGVSLNLVPRWLGPDRPCASISCVFDTRTVYNSPYDNNQLVEFITANGKYYKYILATNALVVTGNNGDANTARWAAPGGPCEGIPQGQCRLNVRNVYNDPFSGNELVEMIYQGGRYWKYRLSNNQLIVTGYLADNNTARYRSANGGPCPAYTSGNPTCYIRNREVYNENGTLVEVLFMNQTKYKWRVTDGVLLSATAMIGDPRYSYP